MTDAERNAVRQRLNAFAIANPPSPAFGYRIWVWLLRHGALTAGLAFVLAAGATGVSAQHAQPGDSLYSFRLSVNDRIETALAFGEDARWDVEMEQLQRMIDAEDAVRQKELGTYAFADNDIDDIEAGLQRELESVERLYESEFGDSEQHTDAESSIAIPDISDGELERELRSMEVDLRAEEGVELELE